MDLNAVGGRHEPKLFTPNGIRCGAPRKWATTLCDVNEHGAAEKSSIRIRKCVRHTRLINGIASVREAMRGCYLSRGEILILNFGATFTGEM